MAIRCVVILSTAALLAAPAAAQTFYEGYGVSFSKTGFADPSLEANQDRITDSVWITRATTKGIYNAAVEPSYNALAGSPADTEWAYGTIADGLGTLTFSDWKSWHGSNPPSSVGQNAVLHLISEDIYLDIRFTAWGVGPGSGGSFGYERAAVPAPAAPALLGLGALAAARRRR